MSPFDELVPGYDAAFTEFAIGRTALDSVPHLPALVAADVTARLRPSAPLVWVATGRYVPWEWLRYLLHGSWTKVLRRLNRGRVSWRGLIRLPADARS